LLLVCWCYLVLGSQDEIRKRFMAQKKFTLNAEGGMMLDNSVQEGNDAFMKETRKDCLDGTPDWDKNKYCEVLVCCLKPNEKMDADILKSLLTQVKDKKSPVDNYKLFSTTYKATIDKKCSAFSADGSIGGIKFDKCKTILFGTNDSPLGNYLDLANAVGAQGWEQYNHFRFGASEAFGTDAFMKSAETVIFNLKGLRKWDKNAQKSKLSGSTNSIEERLNEHYCSCNGHKKAPPVYTCREMDNVIDALNAKTLKNLIAITGVPWKSKNGSTKVALKGKDVNTNALVYSIAPGITTTCT